MPRIQVTTKAGLFHLASGFKAWEEGEFDFPDDPRFGHWLQGQIEQGNCKLAPEPEADEATEGEGLASLTNAQLRALLTEKGIEFKDRATKADLIAALEGEE